MDPAVQPAVADPAAAGSAVPGQRRPEHDRAPGPHVGPGRPSTNPARPGHRPERRRRRLLALAVLLVGLLLVGVRITAQATTVSRAASDTFGQIDTMRLALLAGDIDGAHVALEAASRSSVAGTRASSGPLWRAVAALPVVGNSLRTTSGLTREGVRLTTTGFPALLEAASGLQPAAFTRPDGGIDVAALERSSGRLRAGTAELAASRTRITQLPTTGLIGPVAASRSAFLRGLDSALPTLTSAGAATRLAPGLLGADAPRRYLVALRDPADPGARPGDLVGYAVVEVTAGRPRLLRVGDAAGLVDPPPDTTGTRTWQRANQQPDFAAAARDWAQLWRLQGGEPLDGVLALDPAVLAATLRATGTVVASQGYSVDADTVVGAFTSPELFADPAQLPQLRGEVSRAAIEALLADPRTWTADLVRELAVATDEGRFRLSSFHADEQEILAGTAIGGVRR